MERRIISFDCSYVSNKSIQITPLTILKFILKQRKEKNRYTPTLMLNVMNGTVVAQCDGSLKRCVQSCLIYSNHRTVQNTR